MSTKTSANASADQLSEIHLYFKLTGITGMLTVSLSCQSNFQKQRYDKRRMAARSFYSIFKYLRKSITIHCKPLGNVFIFQKNGHCYLAN